MVKSASQGRRGGAGGSKVHKITKHFQRELTAPKRALRPDLGQLEAPPERGAAPDLAQGDHVAAMVIAEYTAIRQEIQTALANQQSALSVGAATLGLLAAVGARFWPNDLVLGGLVFALAVPAACAMAIRMWYAELLRIARAARFIAHIERWANQSTGVRLLLWETWMYECRKTPEQDIDHDTWRSVVIGFGTLAAMSIALGLYWLAAARGSALAVPIGVVDAVLCARALGQIRGLKRRATNYLAIPEPPQEDEKPRETSRTRESRMAA